MVLKSVVKGFQNGLRVTYDIAKVIIPIYIILSFLEKMFILEKLAYVAQPVMGLMGLPGEASLAIVLGNFLNIYAAIGVIIALSLETKEITILALMLLFSHSLPVELGISKKTGSSILKVGSLRIVAALISGVLLNLII